MKKINVLISTFFGYGYLTKIPGTVTSLVTAVFIYITYEYLGYTDLKFSIIFFILLFFYSFYAVKDSESEFKNKDDNYAPSAWDNGHIISLTGGLKLKNDWEIGMKFRFAGGSPYTPYDYATSSLIQVWDANSFGVFDYNNLNNQRLKANHGLDLRIDKKWFWKKVALNLYMDIQNLYNFQSETQRSLIADQDSNGNIIINPNDPSRYSLKYISNVSGTVLPSIGLQFEF